MINPFEDFKNFSYKKREIPLDHIILAGQNVMDKIIEGYLKFVEEEIKNLVFWLVEHHSRIALAYSSALRIIRGLDYDIEDIEELCLEFDKGGRIPHMISGPAGIYLSALCNNSKEEMIRLRLYELKQIFHFLGYGTPEGKVIVLEGEAGNFVGSGLAGGKLIVEGSTGSWLGAEMKKGEIVITERTGQNTGEWMSGGEIHVDGRIQGIGKTIFGGRIYQHGKLVSPMTGPGDNGKQRKKQIRSIT